MKRIWARVGTTFEVSDENYILLKKAIKAENSEVVCNILESSVYYTDGERYLPPDCDDNPNNDDFEF